MRRAPHMPSGSHPRSLGVPEIGTHKVTEQSQPMIPVECFFKKPIRACEEADQGLRVGGDWRFVR
jgi:hypothetical protein